MGADHLGPLRDKAESGCVAVKLGSTSGLFLNLGHRPPRFWIKSLECSLGPFPCLASSKL